MWRDCKFSEEFLVVNDKKCQLKTNEYEDGGVLPIIDQGENFIAGYTSRIEKKYQKELPVVLFGDHTRHVKFIDFDFVAGADGTQLIRPKSMNINFFLHLTKFTAENLSNHGYDRHMKHLKEASVKYPTNKAEQEAIAEVLDTVDEAIDATQDMLTKQEKIKDGLLQDLLTRGVDKNGKLRPNKLKRNALLSDAVSLVTDKTSTCKDPSFPYIGLEHLDKRTLHISRYGNALDSVSTNNIFSPNNILFGKLRPNLKKCAFVDFHGYCSTDILVLRANDSVHPRFALYLASSEDVFFEAIKSTEGTKMPRTSWDEIKNVKIYLPEPNEQEKIVSIVEAHLLKIRDTQQELSKLKKLKAGLMQDLLTGKKRIPLKQEKAA